MNNIEKLRSKAAENPVFLLFLGACPAMGASAGLREALALGLTVLIISLASALIIKLIGRFIEDWALLWASVIISAGLASIAQLILEAFAPGIYPAISLYTAACAVSLMIFSVSDAGIKSGFKSGLLFLAAIAATALIREFFGSAAVWGNSIPVMTAYKIPILIKAPGGFIVFSLVLAIINALAMSKRKESK